MASRMLSRASCSVFPCVLAPGNSSTNPMYPSGTFKKTAANVISGFSSLCASRGYRHCPHRRNRHSNVERCRRPRRPFSAGTESGETACGRRWTAAYWHRTALPRPWTLPAWQPQSHRPRRSRALRWSMTGPTIGRSAGTGHRFPMAQLRALSERRNLRPLLHVLGFIAMLTATGAVVVLVHRHLSWPWLIPALFVHGTVFRTLQHSRHELSHRTVFRSRFLNELFLRLFSFLQWSSPDHFRASHVRHHQYTVHDELDRRGAVAASVPAAPVAVPVRGGGAELRGGYKDAGALEPRPPGEGRKGGRARRHLGAALLRGPAGGPGRRGQAPRPVRLGARGAARTPGAGGSIHRLRRLDTAAGGYLRPLAGALAQLPVRGDPARRPAGKHARPPRVLPHRDPGTGDALPVLAHELPRGAPHVPERAVL